MRIYNGADRETSYYCGYWNGSQLEIAHNLIQEPDEGIHSHPDCYEYYLPISGSGRLQVNGESVDMLPGNVVMVEPGEKHRIVSTSNLELIVIKSASPNKKEEGI